MTGPEAAAVYAASHTPDPEALRRGLPDMADGLFAQIQTLHDSPSPDAAERLAANLAGASRAVLRYREAMLREGSGNGGQ